MIRNSGIPKVIKEFDIQRDGLKATIVIIEPAFKIEDKSLSGKQILGNLERHGRRCYKSEDMISETSAIPFLEHAIRIGHFSIIEHEKITVSLIVDRGISHEWVRHRLAAYSQESTRYVNYGKRGFQYIYPFFFDMGSPEYQEWENGIIDAAFHYLKLLALGAKPQRARTLLPNSLKTELVATHNIRQWRHIFYQRGDKAAHEQYRQILLPICAEFQKRIPVLFDDLEIDWRNSVIKIKPKEEMLKILDRLAYWLEDTHYPAQDDISDLRKRIQNLVIAT